MCKYVVGIDLSGLNTEGALSIVYLGNQVRGQFRVFYSFKQLCTVNLTVSFSTWFVHRIHGLSIQALSISWWQTKLCSLKYRLFLHTYCTSCLLYDQYCLQYDHTCTCTITLHSILQFTAYMCSIISHLLESHIFHAHLDVMLQCKMILLPGH